MKKSVKLYTPENMLEAFFDAIRTNKLKELQHFLNEHYPEGLPLDIPDEQKFPTADEFLAEEARLWHQARQVNRFISEG